MEFDLTAASFAVDGQQQGPAPRDETGGEAKARLLAPHVAGITNSVGWPVGSAHDPQSGLSCSLIAAALCVGVGTCVLGLGPPGASLGPFNVCSLLSSCWLVSIFSGGLRFLRIPSPSWARLRCLPVWEQACEDHLLSKFNVDVDFDVDYGIRKLREYHMIQTKVRANVKLAS